MNKSIFDLDENIAAAISYIAGPISGIIVLVMERDNRFVRFHALQSTIWFMMLMVVAWVLSMITSFPFIGGLLGIVISPIFGIGTALYVISKLFLMFKAWKNETFKIPIIGDVVWTQVNR